jgi:hypothetical protein
MKLHTSKLSFPVAALAIAAFSIGSARADILANYPFTGSSQASTDADPNSTAGTFGDGAGWTSTIDASRGNGAPSISVISTLTDGTSQAAAVTANDYWTFTITPNAGIALNLSNLSFDYANYSNDATFPTETFFARSSQDSFGANLAAAVTSSTASAGAFATASISLGAAFQNVTTPVEFRIYVSDGTTNANRGALLDNVVLSGTTSAVPEPATLMMLVLGGGLLASIQRVRSKRS